MAYRVFMDRNERVAWVHRANAPDPSCRPSSRDDNQWSEAFTRYKAVELFAYQQGLDVRSCRVCLRVF